ncbi:MAG: hypothetical protein ACEPOV_14750 [Hyphomicrobiales bacterium]
MNKNKTVTLIFAIKFIVFLAFGILLEMNYIIAAAFVIGIVDGVLMVRLFAEREEVEVKAPDR